MEVVLIMVLCLSADPERCEVVRPAEWSPEASLMDCMVFGQHFASDWLRAHPAYADYRLRSWRCLTGEGV